MFIARQPIFNTALDVYGYELLFRSGERSVKFDGYNSKHATATVLGGLFESGIDELVDDKYAFINFDASLIQSDVIELIDPSRLVVEMLEDVVVNDGLVDRLKDLKKLGYRIALDDFVETYEDYPLIPIAEIIKYDLMQTPLDTLRVQVAQALHQNKILLAEKIETQEEFECAKAMGFKLFQGYFFSRPKIVGQSGSKRTAKSQYLQMLQELKRPEPSYQVLAEIIERDAQLAYRMMRIIGSRSGDDLIYSIKKALTYMGLKELERWVNILMIQDLGGEKPKELMRLSLVRTKFLERLAHHSPFKRIKHEASMLGLFSTIDAMLDQDMIDAMKDVPLPKSVVSALTESSGELYPIFELMKMYESGDFERAEMLAKSLELDAEKLLDCYKLALKWAKETMQLMEVV